MKSFEDMDFRERVEWAHGYVFAGLINGGTEGMRTAMWTVSDMWARFPLKKVTPT